MRRRWWPRLVPRSTFLILAGLLLAAPLVAQEERTVENAHILGTVIDRESRAGLGTVRVELTDLDGQEVWAGVTDVQGRFRITLIAAGTYTLTFNRLAYRTVTEDVIVLPEGEVEMRVELASEAIELDPVVVTTSRRSPLQRVGFHDRARSFHGEFLLREDIQDRNPLMVPDLLRMIPAFRVEGTTAETVRVLSQRGGLGLLPGQPTCSPAVFLDGMLIENDPWRVVQPEHLAAMEVYSGMMTPAQFYTRGACGAVVMWTIQDDTGIAEERAGTGRDGHYIFAAVAAALATFHVFLH